MNLATAQQLAVAACYKLQPFCDKINIAGSIRRKKPEVKDIEIVCVPKVSRVQSYDLFGNEQPVEVHTDPGFITTANSLGAVVKGKPTGRYMQIDLPEGVKLDLFIPAAHDYYRQYAIRTGSADYAAKVIAYGWKRLGWCGTDDGLRKQSQCVEKKLSGGKSKWICHHPNPSLPPVWTSEREFFQWLGVMYLEPKDRNI